MTSPQAIDEHRSGYVAIVGRPNVGKSTLLNCLLGGKVSIVTAKPQTTRRRVLGIKTLPQAQVIFVDTPGIHRARDLMNERMVEQAKQAVGESDVVLWLVDALERPSEADAEIARLLAGRAPRVVVALNKLDCCRKPDLLPLMRRLTELLPDAEIIPVSALTGENLDKLLDALLARLPAGPRYYPDDEITTETERAIAAEIVREKVMCETRDELPYAIAVTIDAFEEKPARELVVIKATIHVDKESQKPILIGQGGRRIRSVGQAARVGIEELLGKRVYLELFVRVQPGWTKQAARLREFGL